MATPDFRHQLHLHGPQLSTARRRWARGRTGAARLPLLLAALLALGVALPGRAQRFKGGELEKNRKGRITGITVQNLPNYNNRFFRPGFYVAPQLSRLFVEQSAAYYQAIAAGRRSVTLNPINSVSFAAGFIGDIRLGPPGTPWHLRFAPGASFLTRQVAYAPRVYPLPNADSIKTQVITSTQLDLPLLVKYTSDRRRNTRLYMIAGVKPSVTIGTSRNNPEINMLRASNRDLALEYGVGLDLFYPLFKFAPELRFSHGLANILEPTRDVFGRSLQSLRTNTVTLYINFE